MSAVYHPATDDAAPAVTALNAAFTVRCATADDLPAIIEIYNQSIPGKQATANLEPVTTCARQSWFDEHRSNPKRPIYVVVSTANDGENDRESIAAWGSFSDLYARPAYHISSEISIYLHQCHYRQGLGSLLVDFMLSRAPRLGIKNVVALIFAHNAPSLRLFDKFGFTQWGYLPQVCDMNGFIADVVMLGYCTDNK